VRTRDQGRVGRPSLDERLDDVDTRVREQMLKFLRNFADCKDDLDALVTPRLLGALESRDPDVVIQVAFALANLANGHAQRQALILEHGQLLRSLRSALVSAPADAHCAALR